MELDMTDKKILRLVQLNSMMTADELGEKCGASPSTALRRVKRMRDAGVIIEEVAIVDPKKVGRPLLMIIGVRLEGETALAAADFVRQMRENPAVMQFYFVTGTADYVIHVSARDMDDYNTFVQALVANPHVALTETNVVISPLKMGLRVPIDD